MDPRVQAALDDAYRTESRRVFATLIRLLGDFELAEEALAEAFAAAADAWPRQGVPANPSAWLISAGRFRGIDFLRRRARADASLEALAERAAAPVPDEAVGAVPDDRLRLVFTCCHPALPPDAQVALTLREVCGLTTEEIASAFLVRASTIAQRIVRAKAAIREARLPYEVPGPEALPERLEPVLRVIFLVFNEGYSASSGPSVTRPDLSGEAIRLARVVAGLLPDPEVLGLLALMVLHDARRLAREGLALAARALEGPAVGVFAIQAAIAAEHARPARPADTDWARIVALYELLRRAEPSPVVELNRAVAVAMRDGPAAGLALVDAILARGELAEYHLLHATRGDLARRLGRRDEARAAYARALALARQEPERRFLARRIEELGPG